MTPETIIWLFVSIVLIISNILSYRYMAKKIKVLEAIGDKSTLIQSSTIDNLVKYSNVINPDDFEKRLEWKLNDQREQHEKMVEKLKTDFKTQLDKTGISEAEKGKIINSTILDLNKELGGWLLSYNELTRIIAHNIGRQFKSKSKEERNQFLQEFYPNSNIYFQEILDFEGDTSQMTRF